MANNSNNNYFRYIQMIPSSILIIYGIGFVITSSHLSNYNLFFYNILNINYIKSGLIFLLFISSIILTLLYTNKNPSDDISKNWDESIIFILLTIIFTIIYSKIFVETGYINFKFEQYCLIAFIFLLPILLSIKKLNKYLRLILSVLIVLSFLIFIFIKQQNTRGFILFYFISSVILWTVYGDIGDKNFTKFDVTRIYIILIAFTSMFGKYCYGNIKSEFGGGQPHTTKFIVSSNDISTLQNIGITIDTLGVTEKLNLILESHEFYLINKDTLSFRINKSIFKGAVNKK